MTVIFELLVQTQLIISHLTGKSIKLWESQHILINIDLISL